MTPVMPNDDGRRHARYHDACHKFAPALARLARAIEADADRARDLEQDIHLALWNSLATFDGRCTLGTWVWRVAHNVTATYVGRSMRRRGSVSLDAIDDLAATDDVEAAVDRARLLDRVREMTRRLNPTDRATILLYLEGLDAAAISDVVGLRPSHVAVKIHRFKATLARHFDTGEGE